MEAAPVIGVDVGKDELEVAIAGVHGTSTYPNDLAGRAKLVRQLAKHAPEVIVLEASGGYEQAVLEACWDATLPVARVPPSQVRHFARSLGQRAKTDVLDAALLVHFGQARQIAPQPPPSPERQRLAVLQARREDLVGLKVAERNRAKQARDAVVRASIARVLEVLMAEVQQLEAEMDRLMASCPELQAHAALLETVPGIGAGSARLLLATLPELGQASRQEIAALAGVAPFNHDSGRHRGHRAIAGGRKTLRSGLYMPMLSAISCNPVLGPFYRRLKAKGKLTKVAVIATMRKLLTILNSMLRDGTPWQPPAETTT